MGRDEDVGSGPPVRPELVEQIRQEAVTGPGGDISIRLVLEVRDSHKDTVFGGIQCTESI